MKEYFYDSKTEFSFLDSYLNLIEPSNTLLNFEMDRCTRSKKMLLMVSQASLPTKDVETLQNLDLPAYDVTKGTTVVEQRKAIKGT